MKKLIAMIMAATVALSQLSLVVSAAESNPLQSEDKITAEIMALKQRQEEIKNKRAAQLAASKALVDYGKTTGKTDDLSFYINRKFLTKREYEAFKWSFIFAQFAHPLEDSLLNVFDQEYFQQMIEQDFKIESLRSVLINKGLAPTSDNASTSFDAELQAMMLQDTDFNELVQVTKDNYAVYNLYNRNGTQITFGDMISGEQPLYGGYYIYDTLAVIKDADTSADELNSLLYTQDKITNLDDKYESKVEIKGIAANAEEDTAVNAVMVPVLFYDASTYLYMQTAITIYMREHNIATIEEVNEIFGSRSLVVDSYGNICVRISDNENPIFIPNFGNSVFTNSSDATTGNPTEEESDIVSKMYLYNLWFVSLYSKTTRGDTTIYPKTCKITLNSSGNSDHYSDYLKVSNNGVLSNTYLLTEPSELLPTSDAWAPPESAIPFSHYAQQLGQLYANQHIAEYYVYFGREEGRKTFASPYNSHLEEFLPFTAPDKSSYFVNTHPVVQVDMDYKVGNTDNHQGYTVYYRAGSCLSQGKWRYSYTNRTHCGTTSIVTSAHDNNNNTDQLFAINWIAPLATSLAPSQLIPDPRFSSCADTLTDLDDGSVRTFIFLPKNSLDLGQNMSAYKLSTEKGMFLAKYQLLFSGHVKSLENGGDLREYMKGVTEILANTGSIVTAKSGSLDSSSNKPDEGTAWLLNRTNSNSNKVIARSYFEVSYEMEDDTVAATLTKDFWDAVYDAYDGWISISNSANCVHPSIKTKYLIAKELDDETKYYLRESNSLADDEYLVDVYYYDVNYATPKLLDSETGEVEYEKTGSDDAVLFVTSMYYAIMRRICEIGFKTPDSFTNSATEYAIVCGMKEPDDAIYTMINAHRYNGNDGVTNTMLNIYFYDEYLYLLRSSIAAADSIGCENADTFVEATYYWDRYYLANAYFNEAFSDYLNQQYHMIDGNIQYYEDYLKKQFKTSLEYSFAKWLEDNPQAATMAQGKYRVPFSYEYSLQTESIGDWKTKNSAIASVLSDKAQIYEYLNEDTVIVYPFGWNDLYTKTIQINTGLGDQIYQKSSQSTYRTSIQQQNYKQKINSIQIVLALQKNTDYHHNSLAVTYVKKSQQNHVTREELMDKANTFFENPVSSLSYIITGFFYQIHETIATGDLGSVFSISYLTETDVYVWIMSRYIAIVTIAIAFVLFLKLIQFAMNKSKDFGHIGRSIVGILAMCMTPIMIFNSFIWAFDTTSSWALKDTTNKIMLAQLNRYAAECNNDGNVTAEKQAFKEQFSSIKGTYDCLSFHQMTNYSLDSGATYTTVPVTDMVQNLLYSTLYDTWYSSEGFVPVHSEKYQESYYYFFYDYIKSVFLQYSTKNGNGDSVAKQAAVEFDANRKLLVKGEANQAAININAAENLLHTSKSTFRNMLLDTSFMYKNSVYETQTDRFGGPQVSDITGLHYIFDSESDPAAAELVALLQNTIAFRAYKDSDAMRISNDSMISDTWLNQKAIGDYVQERVKAGKGYRKAHPVTGKYSIYTSGLDPYVNFFDNAADEVNAVKTETAPILTPLEKVLIDVTEKTYDQTLAALNYLPDQINDETAIMLMAIIANNNLNAAMGYEPAEPIQQSILLDDVISTAFLTDLSNIGTGTNTLYSMIQQGDSVAKVALVLALELIICISSILRVAIILYITVASFVILMLRLLNKAPRTTTLIYGIVGNVLALLFLHILTLFLVVIAINWVANALSAIPDLVLNLLMFVFAVLVAWLLLRLVKNLVRDAINLGGSKIRAGITKITDTIANLAGKFQSPDAELNAEIAEINAQQSETRKDLVNALSAEQEAQNNRVDAVAEKLKAAEEAEAVEEAKRATETSDYHEPNSKSQQLKEAEEKHSDEVN